MASDQSPPIDRRRKTIVYGICGLLPAVAIYLLDGLIGQVVLFAVCGEFIAIAFARSWATGQGVMNAGAGMMVSSIPIVGDSILGKMSQDSAPPGTPKEYATLAEALRDHLGESKYRKFVRELNTICVHRGQLLEWQKDAWAGFTRLHPRWAMDFDALRAALADEGDGMNQND